MNIYQIVFSFKGGCYNCPFCEISTRKCRLTDKKIEWRFKVDKKAPTPKEGERPVVKIKFNPHTKRDKDCPLVCEKINPADLVPPEPEK